MNTIATKTQLPVQQIVQWCGIARGKFYDWRKRYGKVNEHNGLVPRDHWIEEWERQSVIDYFDCHPLDGYRRLTFMMLDEDVVAVSPSTTYRVLSKAGRLDRWNPKPSKKGTGFVQPLRAHQHWHTDISYLNLGGTFYYLCSFLDGASRAVVHWEIRESMTEADVECILERAKERYPDARPRIISDNGPQYIAKDFKAFIRISGMTHVRTAPYYPQSNGKIERWHKTIKSDALRPASPTSLEEARRLLERFVEYYNGVRLHSAIGYIAPLDFMDGKATQIWSERDRKLEQARKLRRGARCEQGARMNALIPGAPLRSLSPTSIEYQRAQGASRAAKPARVARFTLDAPEHSGTIPGAIGDILPPGVALTSNLAVIFTLNQYRRT